MQDVFITKIHIDNVRHLHNVDIELSASERKHLIITGRNGSGKTSLLKVQLRRLGVSNLSDIFKATLKTIAGIGCIKLRALYPRTLNATSR